MNLWILKERIYDLSQQLTVAELKYLAKVDGKKQGIGREERIFIAKRGLTGFSYRSIPRYVKVFLDKCQKDYVIYGGFADRDLIMQMKNGCGDAFEELCKRHEAFLEATVKRCIKNTEDYEECLQIAKIAFWKAATRFDIRRMTNVETFAVPHLRGKIYDHLKTKIQFEELDSDMEDGKYVKQYEAIDAKIGIERLIQRAFLTNLERRVILNGFGLEDGIERKLREIAKSEKVSIPYIHKVKNAAIQKLRLSV
ncbi:MAG: sigma-70 family RNA polymerase sigma factor [Syntrophaceae bacterium]|nr:sigma-70 family RNA polymerase sigma factor [Syntrophaceae bacterium]